MTLTRKLELASGVATLVLGLVAPLCRDGIADTFRLYSHWPGLLLDALLLFVIPGLLVAIGSYFDAVKRKTAGFVVLLLGGIFLTLMMLIHMFGGAFYVFGLWAGMAILSQGLLAILTIILSVVVRIPAVRD